MIMTWMKLDNVPCDCGDGTGHGNNNNDHNDDEGDSDSDGYDDGDDDGRDIGYDDGFVNGYGGYGDRCADCFDGFYDGYDAVSGLHSLLESKRPTPKKKNKMETMQGRKICGQRGANFGSHETRMQHNIGR